jgi:DUF2934 family protein
MAKKITSSSSKGPSARRRTGMSSKSGASTATLESPDIQNGTAAAANGRPTDEDIRKLAYELYLSRGAAPGSEIEDWLRAERELAAECEEHAAVRGEL